jgi:hypothetical protein
MAAPEIPPFSSNNHLSFLGGRSQPKRISVLGSTDSWLDFAQLNRSPELNYVSHAGHLTAVEK